MSKGPLAVRWGAPPAGALQAGTIALVRVELENAGALAWRDQVFLAYHWLDDRDNPIVWDGVAHARAAARAGRDAPRSRRRARADPARAATGSRSTWSPSCARGSRSSAARCSRSDVEVGPRAGEPNATLPGGVEPAPDWAERVRAAHAEGYAVVAGAIEWPGGAASPPPRELAPYAPGRGRVPGFGAPLLCPSVLPGHRAGAARRGRRPAGVRRAARRAVGLRRPHRPR